MVEVGINLILSCPLCSFPHFKDVISLRTALVNVATTQQECPVCNEYVMGLDKLTIHLFSHVNDVPTRCHESLNNIQPKIEKQNQCTDLLLENTSFEKSDASNKSVALPTYSEDDQMSCDICNFIFTDKTILELHQKLLHQTNPDGDTGVYNFHCHLCSKIFKKKGSLIVHLRVAHRNFSSVNNKAKRSSSIQAHSGENENLPKSVDNKQWECDVCFKMFTTKYFLKKHKRLHTGEMPYTCVQCNKSFTFQQSYHKHMLYHSTEKPHACNECGRSFKELSTLQNHARIHSGERPFTCETCGKRFRQRVSYLVHRRIHTGVMPYDCQHCGKKFRYKVSQRSHKCLLDRLDSRSSQESKGDEESIKLNIQNAEPIKRSDDVQCILSVNDEGNIYFIKKNNDLNRECNTISKTDEKNHCSTCFTDNHHHISSNNSVPDLYSMDLSPLLPEVEALCLSNSPILGDLEIDSTDNHCQVPNITSQEYYPDNIFIGTKLVQSE